MMVDSTNFQVHFLIKLTLCVLNILSSFVSLEACIYPKGSNILMSLLSLGMSVPIKYYVYP